MKTCNADLLAILRRIVAACALAIAPAALAQGYPAKPIRMIVPYPPGGIDVFVRPLGPKVSEMLGQPVVIDNRGGANGFIGTGLLARAEPDGYTIGFIASATVVGGPILSENAPFDPIKDLTPVIGVVETTADIKEVGNLVKRLGIPKQ